MIDQIVLKFTILLLPVSFDQDGKATVFVLDALQIIHTVVYPQTPLFLVDRDYIFGQLLEGQEALHSFPVQLQTAIGHLAQKLIDSLAVLLHPLEFVDLVQGQYVDHLLELSVLNQHLEYIELVPLPGWVYDINALLAAFLYKLARFVAPGRHQRALEQAGPRFYDLLVGLVPIRVRSNQQRRQTHAVTRVYVTVCHIVADEQRILFNQVRVAEYQSMQGDGSRVQGELDTCCP